MAPDDASAPDTGSLKTFGGFAEIIGLRLIEWELDRCTLELDVGDRHRNGLGVVHGGVISTLVDVASRFNRDSIHFREFNEFNGDSIRLLARKNRH